MKNNIITPLRTLAHNVAARLLPWCPMCKKERHIHMETNPDNEEEALSQGIAILREMTVCNQEALALLEFASAKAASLEQTIAELLKMVEPSATVVESRDSALCSTWSS
jgi:hypothetical protein